MRIRFIDPSTILVIELVVHGLILLSFLLVGLLLKKGKSIFWLLVVLRIVVLRCIPSLTFRFRVLLPFGALVNSRSIILAEKVEHACACTAGCAVAIPGRWCGC